MRRFLLAISALALVLSAGIFDQTTSGARDAAPEVTIQGTLEFDSDHDATYSIVDYDTGERYVLRGAKPFIEQAGGLVNVRGQTLEVTGTLADGTNVINVSAIVLVDEIGILGHTPIGGHVLGNWQYVTLLCKFADNDSEPNNTQHYATLMETVNEFWQENSYGLMDMNDPVILGWYELPDDHSDYMDNGSMNASTRTDAARDCAAAAMNEDDVDLTQFAGINLIFNQGIGGNWGGFRTLLVNNQFQSFGVTWMHPNPSVALAAHEVGHTFGLPHSSGDHGETYDSHWDVMSGGSAHTNIWYKYALGWISDDQRYEATSAANQFIFLERTAQPRSNLGPNEYLKVHFPFDGTSSEFYVAASRLPVGFDSSVPGQGVVLHSVDFDRGFGLNDTPARVVDESLDQDPNDATSRWMPGDFFEDADNNYSLATLQEDPTGFWVLINPELEIGIDAPAEVEAGTDVIVEVALTADGQPAGFLEGLDVRLSVGGIVQFAEIESDGVARHEVMRTTAQTYSLDARFAYLSADSEIEMLPGPPASIDTSIDPSEQIVGEPVTVHAHVTDQFDNNVLDDTQVTFGILRDGVPSETATVVNGDSWVVGTSDGVAAINYTNTLVGTDVITVNAGGVNVILLDAVNWLPGPPAHVDLSIDLAEQTVEEPVTATAIVTDQFDNSVADGTEVGFDVAGTTVEEPIRTDGGSGTNSLTTDGVATFQYTKLFPSDDTVSASAGDDPVITSDPVFVSWILPESTSNSSVNSSGRPMIDFTANASLGGGNRIGGMVHYAADEHDIRTSEIVVVVASGQQALIYAETHVEGLDQLVRVDLDESDTAAQIRWPGYDSGVFEAQVVGVRD